jgi:hypothetical protein
LAESQPSKLLVAGSIPVARSILLRTRCEMEEREPWASEDALHSSEVNFFRCTVGAEAGRKEMIAHVAQLAERVLGKDEVSSSILLVGST